MHHGIREWGVDGWGANAIKVILNLPRSPSPPLVWQNGSEQRMVQPTRPDDRRKLQRCVDLSSS
jgi:hypothetical protein